MEDNKLNESTGTAAATAETQWFALKVISGKERKIREYIENEVKRSKWDNIIKQVLVPTEKVYKILKGKKVIKERKLSILCTGIWIMNISPR